MIQPPGTKTRKRFRTGGHGAASEARDFGNHLGTAGTMPS
jgi:hypothetical protein